MNNLVVQLLLKTGTFSTDLKTAKGQIQNFQKGCQDAGKSLNAFGSAMGLNIGSLTKFGGAIAAAAIAGNGFKAVIDSNQKSADAFEGVIYSCKNVVSELAYAIGTFDFSNFDRGLSDLIRRGREAAAAIDQLGNTIMSYDIIRAESNQKISRARAVLNNPNATKEEKEQAMRDLQDSIDELKSSSSVLLDDYKDAMIKEVASRGIDLTGEGALDILTKWLKADARGDREELKKAAEEGLKVYEEELAQLQSRYKSYKTISGGNTGYTQTIIGVDTSNTEYQKELNVLKQNHKEELTYRVLLEKYSDDELKALGNKRIAMIQTESVIDDLTTQMEKLAKKTGDGVKYQKDSLEYWNKIAQVAKQTRDSKVFNSTEWNNFNNVLSSALEKIKDIEGQTRMLESRKNGLLTPINATTLTGQVTMTETPGLTGEKKKEYFTEVEIQARINKLLEERAKLKEGDKSIAGLNIQLKELKERLEAIQNVGLEIPDLGGTTTKWDQFNSAMAQTATIVSSLTDTFKEGSEITASSILQMVATALPAIGSLINAISALTVTEAVEAGVGAVQKAVSTSKHWIEAIAAVASLGAVVAAAISAASKPNIQKFANGGIVGGSSFTGDRVVANVNSGEMILNRTQQANLFKMANGSGVQSNQVEFHISGTDLVGVLNNNNRKNRLVR